VTGKAHERGGRPAAGPEVRDAVERRRLAFEAERREARGDERLASVVVGRERAALDQRAREIEDGGCGDAADGRRHARHDTPASVAGARRTFGTREL